MFCMYQLRNNCFLFYYIIDGSSRSFLPNIVFVVVVICLVTAWRQHKRMTSGMKGCTKQRYDTESLPHTEILHPFRFIDTCWTFTETRHNVKTVKRWVMHFSLSKSGPSQLVLQIVRAWYACCCSSLAKRQGQWK